MPPLPIFETAGGGEHVRGLCGGLYIKNGIMNPFNVYCQDGPKDVQAISGRTTGCRRRRHGQTRFIWKTVGTSSRGLDDDEYFIKVFQDGVEVYNSGQKFDESSGDSGDTLLGNVTGGDFVVTFDCDLENPLASCEGTELVLTLVAAIFFLTGSLSNHIVLLFILRTLRWYI